MQRDKIDRINALARKKKAEGLTAEEQLEQDALRREYLDEMRNSVRITLDRVYIEQEDGSYQKLRQKPSAEGKA